MKEITFSLEGKEYVELKNLLKIASLVNSGGEAKIIIQNGEISVNGEIETRRGKKLRSGDVILLSQIEIKIVP